MMTFMKIEADTSGEGLALYSLDRAGAIFTALPVLTVTVTLLAGLHWATFAALVYFLAVAVAEGSAALIYLGMQKLAIRSIRRRDMSAPAAA